MSNTKIVLLIILAVAIATLGAYYLEFGKPSVSQSPEPAAKTDKRKADEQKLMQDIGPGASEETEQEYFLLAKSLAEESDSIWINDCKGSPVVLKTAPGKTVTIINQDSQAHTITLDNGNYKYEVSANGSTEIQFNLFRGKGFYSYGCDRIFGPAGILFYE